jgi:hypothetical protein
MTDKSTHQRINKVALAIIIGKAGCASLIILLTALVAGLWLGDQFGQRGFFVIVFLGCSAPLSLFAMVKIALGAAEKLMPLSTEQQPIMPPEKEANDIEELFDL